MPARTHTYTYEHNGLWATYIPECDLNWSKALLYPSVIKTDSFPTRQYSVSLLTKHLNTQTPSAAERKENPLESLLQRTSITKNYTDLYLSSFFQPAMADAVLNREICTLQMTSFTFILHFGFIFAYCF